MEWLLGNIKFFNDLKNILICILEAEHVDYCTRLSIESVELDDDPNFLCVKYSYQDGCNTVRRDDYVPTKYLDMSNVRIMQDWIAEE